MNQLGYIGIYRKIQSWKYYKDSNVCHLFVHMLLNANYTACNGLKKGQLKSGRRKLSEETGISQQTIRTCIKKLIDFEEVTSKNLGKYTVFTIKKYDFWTHVKEDQPAE